MRFRFIPMLAAAADGALGQTAGPRGPCVWITLLSCLVQVVEEQA
ncbi:MAG: hypothetical protein WBQ65_05305 [Bryobacteraceae bacterium]